MYDWPERRAELDGIWTELSNALRLEGFPAPQSLTRSPDLGPLWLAPDLLLGETCSYPLETVLRGRVRYVATPVHDAPGCGKGTYRSVIIAAGKGGNRPVPSHHGADLPDTEFKTQAANSSDSMSGHVAMSRDMEAAGRAMPHAAIWTGSHRASIRAVAEGKAKMAAVDCVSFALARRYEPASADVRIIGWTAERPGLPLITNAAMTDTDIGRIRRAIETVMPITVLDRPTER